MSALSAVLLIFSFQLSLRFSMSVSQARQRRTDLPNIGHRTLPKIWVVFLYGAYSSRGWFWIDSNGKNGNKNPIEGLFGTEFPAICRLTGTFKIPIHANHWLTCSFLSST